MAVSAADQERRRRMKREGRKKILALAVICFCQICSIVGERAWAAESCPYDEPLPANYEGTLSMWGWDREYYNAVTQAFQEKYPNVTFEYVEAEGSNLLQKYEIALISGKELPDIAWAMIDYRGRMFELDMWEALNEKPYSMTLDQVYEYVQPKMVNSRGDICGIEQSLSPVGLMYRKDLAKTYLGTDDPQLLEEMLDDWEAFIEKGRQVQKESEGQVYILFGFHDIMQIVQSQQAQVWIDEETINAEQTFGKTLELMCRFRDEKTADGMGAYWSEAAQEKNHIFTPCTFWSVKLMEKSGQSKENEGKWGLIPTPEGSISWGGTAMGITKSCRDKRLAWEFLKFAALSTEGARALNTIGLMTTAKQPYQEDPSLMRYQSDLFGEQDIGSYFMKEIVPEIPKRTLAKEDLAIQQRLDLIVSVIARDPAVTAADAMEMLKKELQESGICTE